MTVWKKIKNLELKSSLYYINSTKEQGFIQRGGELKFPTILSQIASELRGSKFKIFLGEHATRPPY